jgi:hypothetical protein
MAVPLVIVTVAIAIGVIAAAAVVLYFNPAITNMLGQPEHQQQELIISKEVRSGSNGYRQVSVSVNGLVLIADIAATDEQRTKGLSVKDSLAENEAMLFVFNNEGEHTFWMKNMKFPIDIIWIDADKTVVHIEHSLQTVGGFAEKHGIAKGTPVDFELSA